MGYKGLENFGSGISRYGDLMAQGYKDRQDLQERDQRVAKELDQQRLNDAIKVQEAAKSGLFYDRPDLYQKYGGSMVPETDLSSIGGKAPQQPPAQQAPQAPAQPVNDDDQANAPQGAVDRAPAVVAPPGPTDPSQVTPPTPQASVDQNAQLTQHYQQALQAIATQAPGTVNLQSGFVHPYAAQMAKDIAIKKYEADQRASIAGLVDRGKTTRNAATNATTGGVLAKLGINHLKSLDDQERDLNDPKKNIFLTADQKAQQLAAIQSQRAEVQQSMGHMTLGAQTAQKQAAPPALPNGAVPYGDSVIYKGKTIPRKDFDDMLRQGVIKGG